MAEIIVTSASGILIAVLTGMFALETNRRKLKDAEIELRARQRAEESRLSMALMSAAVRLGTATSLAVEKQTINGEMKEAREDAEKAQKEYWEFINVLAAEDLNRRA
jgi:hypothetical protein